MLTSLFGDLAAHSRPGGRKRDDGDAPDAGFAATAIMQTVATELNAAGQMVDRHSHDLVVSGSPAQAIREHFAGTRADLETATSLITLLDPAGAWAAAVIKALSDAGGRPVERLHLREHTTLRTLATIERTTLVRRHHDTLRICHTDVRAPGSDNAEIPVALMERSHMSTVIIGPLQPHAIDALLVALHTASKQPTWRCPNLLFMLPPNAVWIATKISATAWPGHLHVHVLNESMTSASSVWNAMLGIWNHVKAQPGRAPAANPPLAGMNDLPVKRAAPGEPARVGPRSDAAPGSGTSFVASTTAVLVAATSARATPWVTRIGRSVLDPARAKLALAGMLSFDGLLGGAVVDSTSGLVLARESRTNPPVDMDRAAAACAQVLRAHRRAARSMGLPEHVDEVMTSAGPRQQLMRTVSRHPELFLVVLLDKHRTNLALARYQLMEVERDLA